MRTRHVRLVFRKTGERSRAAEAFLEVVKTPHGESVPKRTADVTEIDRGYQLLLTYGSPAATGRTCSRFSSSRPVASQLPSAALARSCRKRDRQIAPDRHVTVIVARSTVSGVAGSRSTAAIISFNASPRRGRTRQPDRNGVAEKDLREG